MFGMTLFPVGETLSSPAEMSHGLPKQEQRRRKHGTSQIRRATETKCETFSREKTRETICFCNSEDTGYCNMRVRGRATSEQFEQHVDTGT